MTVSISPRDIYKLVENDKGEIMLIIYVRDQTPQKPVFLLNPLGGTLTLKRTPTDSLFIAGLDSDAVAKLNKTTQLYVCEIEYTPNHKEESKIIHTYLALKEKTTAATSPHQSNSPRTISEKAKSARAKALKKTNK